jgi:hypothetical protein
LQSLSPVDSLDHHATTEALVAIPQNDLADAPVDAAPGE